MDAQEARLATGSADADLRLYSIHSSVSSGATASTQHLGVMSGCCACFVKFQLAAAAAADCGSACGGAAPIWLSQASCCGVANERSAEVCLLFPNV